MPPSEAVILLELPGDVRLSPRSARVTDRAHDVAEAVLQRVVIVGVSDPEPAVREAVLRAFTPNFDALLAESCRWEMMLMALGDETTSVREVGIGILGRLASRNPGHLMPSLRSYLFDLLTEIKHSHTASRKEDAAHLLGTRRRTWETGTAPRRRTGR